MWNMAIAIEDIQLFENCEMNYFGEKTKCR